VRSCVLICPRHYNLDLAMYEHCYAAIITTSGEAKKIKKILYSSYNLQDHPDRIRSD
jgi:hypothetical protein